MYDKNLCQNGWIECLARKGGCPLAFRYKVIHRAVIDFQLQSTYSTIKGAKQASRTSTFNLYIIYMLHFIAIFLINSKKVIDKILSEN